MDIHFSCACGQVIFVPREMAGREGRCPHCQAVVMVPDTPEADAGEQAPAPAAPAEDGRICPACGEKIKAVARKCRFCGEILDPSLLTERRAGPTPEEVLGPRRDIPAPEALPTSGLAIGSLILALLGLFCGFTSIPAIIMGHMAMADIKRGRTSGSGMALTGLIMGYVFAGLFLIWWLAVIL